MGTNVILVPVLGSADSWRLTLTLGMLEVAVHVSNSEAQKEFSNELATIWQK